MPLMATPAPREPNSTTCAPTRDNATAGMPHLVHADLGDLHDHVACPHLPITRSRPITPYTRRNKNKRGTRRSPGAAGGHNGLSSFSRDKNDINTLLLHGALLRNRVTTGTITPYVAPIANWLGHVPKPSGKNRGRASTLIYMTLPCPVGGYCSAQYTDYHAYVALYLCPPIASRTLADHALQDGVASDDDISEVDHDGHGAGSRAHGRLGPGLSRRPRLPLVRWVQHNRHRVRPTRATGISGRKLRSLPLGTP